MNQFTHTVKSYILSNDLLKNDKSVLVALSGGADSVALLLVLLDLGYSCVAAHCNFHLRGEESMRDESFVRALCTRLNVPLEVRDFDVAAHMQAHGVSLEMACRDLRYAWFEQVLARLDCQAVAVAHHRDDNIETFWLNALRGSGIAGLAAMHPRNAGVVRPLLRVSREQINAFLAGRNQPFVTDSTNAHNDVKRNRLRNVVMPVVEKQFPACRETLAKTIESTLGGLELYRELIDEVKARLCTFHADGFDIDIARLLSYKNSSTLLFELLKPWGFNHVQCLSLIDALSQGDAVGKHVDSATHSVVVKRNQLEVLPLQARVEEVCNIDLKNNDIEFPIKLNVEHKNNVRFNRSMIDGKRSIALDASVLNCNKVVLRHWRAGDRFRPFGLHGTKLLSDLFVDLKLSERERRRLWVMEADGCIVWVVGYRAADVFRVSQSAPSCFIVLAMA